MLRRRNSGESDRRLTLLTRELGKIDVVAKGARKGGSRLAGSSDPLAVAQMSLALGRKNLFVTQAQPITSFRALRHNYERLTYALALLELYSAVVPYEQADPDAHDLLLASLQALESHDRPLAALVWAELRLMGMEGFLPQFDGGPSARGRVEHEPFVSPQAGGYVTAQEAARHSDRLKTRPEVLYGLAKTALLDEAPSNLRFADECAGVLLAFWRHIAEMPLPANESLVAQIRLK